MDEKAKEKRWALCGGAFNEHLLRMSLIKGPHLALPAVGLLFANCCVPYLQGWWGCSIPGKGPAESTHAIACNSPVDYLWMPLFCYLITPVDNVDYSLCQNVFMSKEDGCCSSCHILIANCSPLYPCQSPLAWHSVNHCQWHLKICWKKICILTVHQVFQWTKIMSCLCEFNY